jgi:hypothetical protein
MSIPPWKARTAAYWTGALVDVKVSLATASMASSNQCSAGGKAKVPRRQPPAPHHFESPLLTIVPWE